MISYEQALHLSGIEIQKYFPQLVDFLSTYGIHPEHIHESLGKCIDELDENLLQDNGFDREQLHQNLEGFTDKMRELAAGGSRESVKEVRIFGGRDKSGKPETLDLILRAGEITGIVGPTGSGKSRLLADIEWLAQGDTPTGRRVWVNGATPRPDLRFSIEDRIVAQLSQNMNFVMDASVETFIKIHAESRMIPDPDIVERVISHANELAGERFDPSTPVTGLSGGQSRALMIADVAFLSTSPVVLIDEIENAGVDRNRALSLLAGNDKIVLIATHDPILALMCRRRVIIRNGAVSAVIESCPEERKVLEELSRMDAVIQSTRHAIRSGESICTLSS